MFTGPNIVEEGLVLALDAANVKSFRGEPTTNTFSSTKDLNASPWVKEGAVSISPNSATAPDGTQTANTVTYASTGNLYFYQTDRFTGAGGFLQGQTYTISIWAKGAVGGETFILAFQRRGDGTSTYSSTKTLTTEWVRYTFTKTLPSDSSHTSLWGLFRGLLNSTFYVWHPQIEQKSSATRFTTGTRGTTVATGGGWADISGNDNHGTINNGASTSNDKTTRGALTFDGTNDYISKTRVQYGITDPWTVELIFKPTSQVSYWNGLFGGSLNQGGYWMFHSDQLTNYEGYSGDAGTRIKYTGWSYSNTFTVNQFHYLTITYSPIDSSSGTFNLYYNGTEKTQSYNRTFYWSHSLDSRYIGGIAAEGRYGAFAIPLCREYSRTLTQNEVLQNYNSLKTRFGL